MTPRKKRWLEPVDKQNIGDAVDIAGKILPIILLAVGFLL